MTDLIALEARIWECAAAHPDWKIGDVEDAVTRAMERHEADHAQGAKMLATAVEPDDSDDALTDVDRGLDASLAQDAEAAAEQRLAARADEREGLADPALADDAPEPARSIWPPRHTEPA